MTNAEISTAALAYLGDSVLEVKVREMLVGKGIYSSKNLNREALLYVTAPAQARAVGRLLPILNDDETAVYKRGRNIGHTNVPKKATVAEYRMATGLEALFGYLYLNRKESRVDELFRAAFMENENTVTNTEGDCHESSEGTNQCP